MQQVRWSGLDEVAGVIRKRWDALRYLRVQLLSGCGHTATSDDDFRIDFDPDNIEELVEELRDHLADGVDFEHPELEDLVKGLLAWIVSRAENILIEYPAPALFKVFYGGIHETRGRRDLTSARFRADPPSSLGRAQPPQAAANNAPPPPPPAASVPPILPYPPSAFQEDEAKQEDGAKDGSGSGEAAEVLRSARSMLGLMDAFCRSVVVNTTQLTGAILTGTTQANTLSQTMLANVAHQNEVLQAKLTDSSTRLFQRADEQQQRSAEERRELFEQQAEERKAATRMEIGKQIVHQLGALGQTYLGGKAIPPELLELLPILPPEVFQALTDKDVIDALKNSAELREVLKEMVVNVRDSVKAGKAKAEAEAAQKAAGEKNQGGKPPNDNEEAA